MRFGSPKWKFRLKTPTGGNTMARANESAFEAAKNAYTLYGWLLQEVAKEAGWDKAIAINAGIGERIAGIFAGMVRAKCGEQKPDAACVAGVLEDVNKGSGIDYEIQARESEVTIRYERCPIYEGLVASGIDPATIQRLCQGISGRQYEQLHGLIPELTGKIRIRESASDTCLEERVLAK
jgi:hypothetical protein